MLEGVSSYALVIISKRETIEVRKILFMLIRVFGSYKKYILPFYVK